MSLLTSDPEKRVALPYLSWQMVLGTYKVTWKHTPFMSETYHTLRGASAERL